MGNKRSPGCHCCGDASDCPCIDDFAGAALEITMPFPDGDNPLTDCSICGPFEPSATCDTCNDLSGTYPITWSSPTVCSFCNSSSIFASTGKYCWQYGSSPWPFGTDCSSERFLTLFRANNAGCFNRPIALTITPSGSDLLVVATINYTVVKVDITNCGLPTYRFNYKPFTYRFEKTFADCASITGALDYVSVTSTDNGNSGQYFYDATVTDPCNTESAIVEITR